MRISYTGDKIIVRTLEHAFHRERLDEHYKLGSSKAADLAANPHFEVDDSISTHDTAVLLSIEDRRR